MTKKIMSYLCFMLNAFAIVSFIIGLAKHNGSYFVVCLLMTMLTMWLRKICTPRDNNSFKEKYGISVGQITDSNRDTLVRMALINSAGIKWFGYLSLSVPVVVYFWSCYVANDSVHSISNSVGCLFVFTPLAWYFFCKAKKIKQQAMNIKNCVE